MSLGLLFSGQGSQHPYMLRWLDGRTEAAQTLTLMAQWLGADWRARLHDADWAHSNGVAQVLLTGLGIAASQCLSGALTAPGAVAGYSVGELAAFCAAGVFDAPTALTLATERAALMDRSVAGQHTGLLAVHGVAAQPLAVLCERHGLAVAIRLAPDRAVLGGASDALARADAELRACGAHCTPLTVRVASHTPWVSGAARAFEARLAAVPFAVPRLAVVCNRSGAVERRPIELRQALAQQIDSTVPWDVCMDTLAERGVRCVLELGPGCALAKLWNERHPGIQARSADEFRGPEAIAQWVSCRLR